jgi:hypothetical protein
MAVWPTFSSKVVRRECHCTWYPWFFTLTVPEPKMFPKIRNFLIIDHITTHRGVTNRFKIRCFSNMEGPSREENCQNLPNDDKSSISIFFQLTYLFRAKTSRIPILCRKPDSFNVGSRKGGNKEVSQVLYKFDSILWTTCTHARFDGREKYIKVSDADVK